MKNKYIKFILTLMVIILLPFIKIKAAPMDSYIDWNLDRTVFAHQYKDGSDHITNLALITANGKIAYCIEPGITADKGGIYNSSYNVNDTSLKNKDVKKLSLIGYYGYGYEGHNVKEYYMAAQELIWRLMGVENVWWTDKKEGGNILNIDSYKNEIMSLVNSYEISPEFDFKNRYMVGDEITLEDKKNVLQEYDVVGNKDVKKDKNKIIIKVKQGDNSFILKRKQNGKNAIFYYKDGYQTIGSFEYPYDYQKSYNINYDYGKIIVKKFDFDSKNKPSSPYATLKGAMYGLYDENGSLISSKSTNLDGVIVFDNLPKASYTIKEISPSKGYTLDTNIYDCTLNSDRFTITVTSYEKIIKNKIVITKVLDDEQTKTCIPEEGILFYVYDENDNFIMEKLTDKNGNITLELDYGKYRLKQITSLKGVDKVKDLFFEVTEDGLVQNFALVNHRLKKDILPNTGKNLFTYSSSIVFLIIFGVLHEKKRT